MLKKRFHMTFFKVMLLIFLIIPFYVFLLIIFAQMKDERKKSVAANKMRKTDKDRFGSTDSMTGYYGGSGKVRKKRGEARNNYQNKTTGEEGRSPGVKKESKRKRRKKRKLRRQQRIDRG